MKNLSNNLEYSHLYCSQNNPSTKYKLKQHAFDTVTFYQTLKHTHRTFFHNSGNLPLL